jgi:hypothetical protein
MTENAQGKVEQYSQRLVNDPLIEYAWARKAVAYAETHFKLISSTVDLSKLTLSPLDDIIYAHFLKLFPDFKVDIVDDAKLKSENAKEIWRSFMSEYVDRIYDWNFATLLRKDATSTLGYCDTNTIIVPRIQFLAIEIARNRQGCYVKLREALRRKSTESRSE